MREENARRFLAGVRFVDAVTGLPIGEAIRARGAGVELVQNRRGVLGVRMARGLGAHVDHTDPATAAPALPGGALDYDIEAWDAAERYVPRRFTLTLPRPWSDAEDGLYEPVDVPMYPAPTARLQGNWAALRGRVVDEDDAPIGGALVCVRLAPEEGEPEPGAVIARGLTALAEHPASPGHARRSAGEFLVCVAGLPVTTWGGGEAAPRPAVVIEIVVDPSALGRPPHPENIENPPAEGPPQRVRAMVPGPITLAPGQREVVPPVSVELQPGG